MEMEKEEQIINILDKLRPFLVSDGGNLEFIKFEGNKVYIRMLGACASCSIVDVTLKDGIEATLKEEVDQNIEVINVTD